MALWRKKTVRHVIDGRRVRPGTPGAVKLVERSKRFYGTLRQSDGKSRQVPLCEDRDTSRMLLRRLQTEADTLRAFGVNAVETDHRTRPIGDHVGDYAAYLLSKANTGTYVSLHVGRLRAVLNATGAETIADLDTSRISRTLSRWRSEGPDPTRRGHKRTPISAQTSNHYVQSCRGFSRWLWTDRRAKEDLLRGLPTVNAKADRRRVRRALSGDDLRSLMDATRASRVPLRGLCGGDRAMLYTVAAFTGLRAAELASLTRASFDVGTMTVTVLAAYSKHRREDVLPLHDSLAGPLSSWMRGRDGRLWPGNWASERRAAMMLRHDLKGAGIPYVDETGRVADFHALRHTFVTSLARSGVHVSVAKSLARHSTVTLTIDVYSHVETEELRRSLDTLPALPSVSSPDDREAPRAVPNSRAV